MSVRLVGTHGSRAGDEPHPASRGLPHDRLLVVVLDTERDVELPDLESAKERLVAVGPEGKGLSKLMRESYGQIASVPMNSAIESLNAGLATGVTSAWSPDAFADGIDVPRRVRALPSRASAPASAHSNIPMFADGSHPPSESRVGGRDCQAWGRYHGVRSSA